MPDAAIAIDGLEALEILLQFAAQIAFDDVLVFLDDLNDAVKLLIGQRLGADVGADFSLFEDQPMTAAVMSVIETIVLLNVAEMWAMPE